MASVEYSRATEADYEELLDFVNYVFSTDFLKMIPQVYKPEYKKSFEHYIVKEDGKIKSALASLPMEMAVCGECLKVRGISTVSVHQYSRRKGYMKALMDRAMEDMKHENVDLACLGGKRQRYAHFSFEPCGTVLEFYVTQENIQHSYYGDNSSTDIDFRKVSSNEHEVLSGMRAMHDAQPEHVVRGKEFYDVLISSFNIPYAIYQKGKLAGYISADSEFHLISEMVLDARTSAENVVRELFNTFKPTTTLFQCAPWQKDRITFLESIAEKCSIIQNHNFTVLNYINVVRVLMKFKATYTALADGELTLCVIDIQSLKITVSKGKPKVEEYSGECDVVLPHLQAMRFLFSPVSALYDFNTKKASPQAQSWFPLPLFFPNQDKV